MILNIVKNLIHDYSGLLLIVINLFAWILLSIAFIKLLKEKKRLKSINNFMNYIANTVNSVRYGDLSKKIDAKGIPATENLTDSLNRMIETLHDREAMIREHQGELTKQNLMLEAMINSLSDGLIITNAESKILRITDNVTLWIGAEKKDLIGQYLTKIIKLEKNRPFVTWQNNEATINANKVDTFSVSTIPLNYEEKNKHYIVILKNITDQKELENLKEDFVATLTHDLKVPIIAETNMIELFLNENFGEITEKQKFALKNMQVSNKELLELVQTVLDTYKMAKITLYKENIMLKSFLEEVVDEMRPIARKTQNTIDLDITRDIRVLADKMQLKRVVKNLIQNALLYGAPKTPVQISIGEIPKFIIIKVKDFGKGIPQCDLEKIFNKYYSASKKFKKVGTGLGLYLALQILKAHEGDLTVESIEGEYTEFCIKIPV
ncbi:PAS domain-containing sensor histidine kinase [bacterium]|nr:PAS domain-containing sensor histidine kinase [bacterium]